MTHEETVVIFLLPDTILHCKIPNTCQFDNPVFTFHFYLLLLLFALHDSFGLMFRRLLQYIKCTFSVLGLPKCNMETDIT